MTEADRVCEALGDIRDELARLRESVDDFALALLPPSGDVPDPEPCQHPLEYRVDFGVTNGQPDWECEVCGYRTAVHEVTA